MPLALLWKGYESHKSVGRLEVLFAEDLDQHITQFEWKQQQWINELIQSIREADSEGHDRGDALFDRLSNLSVGPVRTMMRGL